MAKLTVFDEMDAPDSSGTSLKGYVVATYEQLVNFLGQPTFGEESGDGKVQVEWIVKFKDDYGGVNLFTIYDWKFYSRDHIIFPDTMVNWHVGGKSPAYDLIDYLEKRI
jgi:hypothetical protein